MNTLRSYTVLGAVLVASASVHAQAPPPANFPGTPPPSPPVTIQSFAAEPAALEPGGGTTLRWEAINTYSLTIEPDLGTVATRGSARLTPPATTTYTLTAVGSSGTITRSITVAVAGTVPRTAAAPSSARPTGIPRLANGKPDLSGLYAAEGNVRLAGAVARRPGAEAFRVPPAADDLGSGVSCLPPGVPAATMLPFPLQIVHTADTLVIVYEAYHQFRIVPVGREHADYLAPAYMGHSVARWDGDTLVVEVRGFNDKTLVAGHRHTEALQVTERYRRTAFDTLEYEALVEEPNVFATPVRYAGTLTLHPEWDIGEYVCTENDQNYDALFDAEAN